jgi:hypothetical protein
MNDSLTADQCDDIMNQITVSCDVELDAKPITDKRFTTE